MTTTRCRATAALLPVDARPDAGASCRTGAAGCVSGRFAVTAPGASARTTISTYDDVGQLTGVANPDGTLTYSFVEALQATHPFYIVRLIGGLMVLSGMFLMAYNVRRTLAERATIIATRVMAPA